MHVCVMNQCGHVGYVGLSETFLYPLGYDVMGHLRTCVFAEWTLQLGVAMGNAGPKARAAADVVVATNDEDGVAEAISK